MWFCDEGDFMMSLSDVSRLILLMLLTLHLDVWTIFKSFIMFLTIW